MRLLDSEVGSRRIPCNGGPPPGVNLSFSSKMGLFLTYRVGYFDWSALKNDYVPDYIINPIKKVSEFPKGVALLGQTSKRTLYEIEKPRVPDKSFQII